MRIKTFLIVCFIVTLSFGLTIKPKVKKNQKVNVNTVQSSPTKSSIKRSIDQSGLDELIHDSLRIKKIDYVNTPISEVLRLVCTPFKLNYSVDTEVKDSISILLHDIKLKDAISYIIAQYNLDYEVINGVITVFNRKSSSSNSLFIVNDGLLSVDFTQISVDELIRLASEVTQITIVPEERINKNLSSFFSHVSPDKGIELILLSNNIAFEKRDNIYYVSNGIGKGYKSNRSFLKKKVFVKDGKVTFSVEEAPLSDLIKEIAIQENLDIYFYGNLNGSITANVNEIPVNDVFESLLRNTTYTFWKSKDIYYFGNKELFEKQVFELIKLNYLKANEVMKLLPSSLKSKANVKVVKDYNALLIEAPTSDIIETAKSFIHSVDKPIAQILIEAWVVEVKNEKLRKFDIKAGRNLSKREVMSFFPDVSVDAGKKSILQFVDNFVNVSSATKALIPNDFGVQLDFLEHEGVTNLISKPQIATLNGHPASITFGTTEYYLLEKEVVVTDNDNKPYPVKDQRYEKINVDMTLSVTPWVSGNDEVTMEINPNFDVPGVSPSPDIPPSVNRRSLSSTVRVKNGEMIILGGLISESNTNSYKKIPLLGRIPIIGRIFSSKNKQRSKSQLMIYLIPRVYYGSERTVNPVEIEERFLKNPLLQK